MTDVIICGKFNVVKLSSHRYTEVQTLVCPIEMADHHYNSVAQPALPHSL